MNATVFGRVGRDAELKQTTSGTSVANFSVALNVYAKDGQSKVTWVRAAIFGNQADSLAAYLKTGTSVALSGDLVLREYDDTRDGGRKTSLDMNVNSVALLGGGQKEQPAAPPRVAPPPARRPAPPAPQRIIQGARPVQAAPAQPPDDGNYDDSIGF